MMLPRIGYYGNFGTGTLHNVGLDDWADSPLPISVEVVWSEWNGVYVLAAEAHDMAPRSRATFPGFATVAFSVVMKAN